MTKKIPSKQLILTVIVFIIFIFFRFFNLTKRIGLDWDQETYSFIVKDIIKNHKLTLIGPRVMSEHGFFLAPYFYYILVPFYFLFHLNPSALVFFIIFINLLFFATGFYIIKKIFGFYYALFFFLLWSINHLLLTFDTVVWNPILIPLGVIVIWFQLARLYQKKSSILDWAILGLTLGFFVNMHFQFVFIILFCLFFIFINRKRENFFDIKKALAAVFSFSAVFAPLFLFDLRHDFLNSKLLLSFFASGNRESNYLWIWIPVFENFIQPLTYFKNFYLTFFVYFAFLAMLIYLAFNRKGFFKQFYLASIFLWLSFFIAFSFFYGKRPSEYYFLFISPFLYISLIDFFAHLRPKKLYLVSILLLFIIVSNAYLIYTQMVPSRFGLYAKEQVILELKKLVDLNKKFNISFDMPLGRNQGYRYIIDYYNIKQSGNWSDPLIQMRMPPKENDLVIGLVGLSIPKAIMK